MPGDSEISFVSWYGSYFLFVPVWDPQAEAVSTGSDLGRGPFLFQRAGEPLRMYDVAAVLVINQNFHELIVFLDCPDMIENWVMTVMSKSSMIFGQ